MLKEGRRRWVRWSIATAIASYAALVALEAWMNGAEDPYSDIRMDEPNVYAQSVCAMVQSGFLAPRTLQADPCLAKAEVRRYLHSVERRNRIGYTERFGWTCESGGRVTVWVRAGVNWTGFCLRCRSSAGGAQCEL